MKFLVFLVFWTPGSRACRGSGHAANFRAWGREGLHRQRGEIPHHGVRSSPRRPSEGIRARHECHGTTRGGQRQKHSDEPRQPIPLAAAGTPNCRASGPGRALRAQAGESRLVAAEGPLRGSSARIPARPTGTQDPTNPAAAIRTWLPYSRRVALFRHGRVKDFQSAKRQGAPLPRPADSRGLPAVRRRKPVGRSAEDHATPQIPAPHSPGQPCQPQVGNGPSGVPKGLSVAPAWVPTEQP